MKKDNTAELVHRYNNNIFIIKKRNTYSQISNNDTSTTGEFKKRIIG